MKAIDPHHIALCSLHQPYATLMAINLKHHETRAWGANTRGWIAIHAAAKKDQEVRDGIHFATSQVPEFAANLPVPFGAVVALGILRAVYRTEDLKTPEVCHLDEIDYQWGDYAPGRKAWYFPRVHRLRSPIPWKATQGIPKASPELAALIHAQLPWMLGITGQCRECGCSEERACRDGESGECCCWTDEEHTLCSQCVVESIPPNHGKPVKPNA